MIIKITEGQYNLIENKLFNNEKKITPKNEVFDKITEEFNNVKSKLSSIGYVTENYNWNVIEEAEYRGRKVKLNKPFRQSSGGKKFAVYVKTPKGNVKKVRFGASGYRVRNKNKKRAKNFQKRHNCDKKKDKTKAGYWSCRISRYAKQLGLSSTRSW